MGRMTDLVTPKMNSSQPLVSIILLNWHGWRDTIACLDSLVSQDYNDYRVLVVDNGSTDDSVARIRAAHPEIPIMETGRNLGFSGGCNVGVRRALEDGADYVWLLNNDTTVDPQALSAMVAVAEADPRVGAVGSVLYGYGRQNRTVSNTLPDSQNNQGYKKPCNRSGNLPFLQHILESI